MTSQQEIWMKELADKHAKQATAEAQKAGMIPAGKVVLYTFVVVDKVLPNEAVYEGNLSLEDARTIASLAWDEQLRTVVNQLISGEQPWPWHYSFLSRTNSVLRIAGLPWRICCDMSGKVRFGTMNNVSKKKIAEVLNSR